MSAQQLILLSRAAESLYKGDKKDLAEFEDPEKVLRKMLGADIFEVGENNA